MKRLLMVCCALLWAAGAFGADGKTLFEESKCTMCHHAEGKGAGPSVDDIAKAYAGKKAQLEDYLAGKAEPQMEPGKAHMMKRYLEKLAGMSAEERAAIAGYVLGEK